MIPAPARTRQHLADALTIHGATVLQSAHATDAVLRSLRHDERRGALHLAKDATTTSRDAYLSFVDLQQEVLAFTSWDGLRDRRVAA